MNANQPTKRHEDLSKMFYKMGKALYKEGMSNKDYITASIGNIMIAMSSTVLSAQETRLLGELCSMMSARRVVKKISNGEFDISKFSGKTGDSFDEIMRKLNQRKKDEDEGEIPDSE